MSTVRRVVIGLLATVGLLVAGASAVPVAHAEEQTVRPFVVQLSAENEVPGCPAGVASGATGVAIIHIDPATGEITYTVVANDLPATIAGPSTGAHIHVIDPNSPTGQTGPIVLHFERTGLNEGVVAQGTTTSLALATAILACPENSYVNVHTTACPTGTIRGSLA